MEHMLTDFKKIKLELIIKYFLIYCDQKAFRHLFRVTCGMDSMVLGEDEILGQIKSSYETALALGTTKYLLNTLFQAAITCAKRIKTDTMLSKTPVSIGTLTANEILRFPGQMKNVMIIGLTGKMGTIIMKNIYGKKDIKIIGTSRSHNAMEHISTEYQNVRMIEYKDRYQAMDEADIIISATTSPHYTVTFHELDKYIHTVKDRLFIDLSVPMDIDKDVVKIMNARIYDIDYFNRASQNNILIKENETLKAESMIDEYLDEVCKEISFHSFLDDMPKLRTLFAEKSLEHIIYELKDKSNHEELAIVFELFRRLI
jgi:glutamyl-tRNA reductase